jgi:hypothetical protein
MCGPPGAMPTLKVGMFPGASAERGSVRVESGGAPRVASGGAPMRAGRAVIRTIALRPEHWVASTQWHAPPVPPARFQPWLGKCRTVGGPFAP